MMESQSFEKLTETSYERPDSSSHYNQTGLKIKSVSKNSIGNSHSSQIKNKAFLTPQRNQSKKVAPNRGIVMAAHGSLGMRKASTNESNSSSQQPQKGNNQKTSSIHII
jgi:hypothetical protein